MNARVVQCPVAVSDHFLKQFIDGSAHRELEPARSRGSSTKPRSLSLFRALPPPVKSPVSHRSPFCRRTSELASPPRRSSSITARSRLPDREGSVVSCHQRGSFQRGSSNCGTGLLQSACRSSGIAASLMAGRRWTAPPAQRPRGWWSACRYSYRLPLPGPAVRSAPRAGPPAGGPRCAWPGWEFPVSLFAALFPRTRRA